MMMPAERFGVTLSPGIYVPPRLGDHEDEALARVVKAKVVISRIDTRGACAQTSGLDKDGDPTAVTNRYGAGETAEHRRLMTELRWMQGVSICEATMNATASYGVPLWSLNVCTF